MRDFILWTAGFFDGEGCVNIYVREKKGVQKDGKKRANDLMVLNVSISQTKFRDPLDEICDLFGGSMSTPKVRENEQTQYRWSSSGAASVAFLEAVLPFLRIKRRQAEIGIEFQSTMRYYDGSIVTQKEIAEQLGIANSTVNACIKDNYKGSQKTKELVLKTAEEMGYDFVPQIVPPEIMQKRQALYEELRELNKRGK